MRDAAMSRVLELFGHSTKVPTTDWALEVKRQHCPFLGRTCIKTRKSAPGIAIGTCSVGHGADETPLVICPHRMIDRRKILTDSLHLLTRHEPGNELHVLREVTVPGGSVDYFIVSVRQGRPVDFVGVEIQTLDTTGTVWPARQRFLQTIGLTVSRKDAASTKTFGVNWKMTAKTILVQLHHKVETFEHLSKHLVLTIQDTLLAYVKREFRFGHLNEPTLGDSLHVHAYGFELDRQAYRMQLASRQSTDAAGIAKALGMQTAARVELTSILDHLTKKINDETLWTPL